MVHPDLNRQETRFMMAQRNQSFWSYVIAGGYGLETLLICAASMGFLNGHSGWASTGARPVALAAVFSSLLFGSALLLLRRGAALARVIDELDETSRVLADGQATAARIRAFSNKMNRETSLG